MRTPNKSGLQGFLFAIPDFVPYLFLIGLRFPFKITQSINLKYNDIDSWLKHASFEDVLTENGDLFISMLRLPLFVHGLGGERKRCQSFEQAQMKQISTRDYDRLNCQPAISNLKLVTLPEPNTSENLLLGSDSFPMSLIVPFLGTNLFMFWGVPQIRVLYC